MTGVQTCALPIFAFHHHDALEDARTCAAIPVAAAKMRGVRDMAELAEMLRVPIRPFAMG